MMHVIKKSYRYTLLVRLLWFKREPNMIVLRNHWLLSKKADENGNVIKIKARNVIDGSDLDESKFAPVINVSFLRTVMNYAVKNRYVIHTIDIKNAYLNADLEEEIYMYQIQMYENFNKPDYVCKINKSLYGLPQSAFNFYNLVKEYFLSNGLLQSKIENCIYFNSTDKSFVGTHVDDMIIMVPNENTMTRYKQMISSKFQIKDNGSITNFLGTEFKYNEREGTMRIKQEAKIENLYQYLGNDMPKVTKLPIPSNINIFQQHEAYDDITKYQSIIGSINYISTTIRPDITTYVNQLAKFLKNPTIQHYRLACKIVAYLYATKDYGISYDAISNDNNLYTFTDASSFMVVENKSKRMTGVVVMYHESPIHWTSRKQTATSADICEGELYAINSGLKSAIAFRNLLDEIGIASEEELKLNVYCDNQSALDISKEGLKKNSKHYNLSLLFVQDYLERGELNLDKVLGAENVADLMTKFVDHSTFYKHFFKLRMQSS